uniref:NHL repeat-containing protein n=1 Tax=Knipowitschia caucasica TaxID=637954 RepID=A0AAV2K0C8_KNICA
MHQDALESSGGFRVIRSHQEALESSGVTDCRGNVLQQIGSSSSSSSSSRKCRNYFDVAVNSRGLVALSCASERALLVFSRHGRLLQTYGGHQHQQHQYHQQQYHQQHKDELEAPRGVTVTRADEFLVADIRKGTLIALKLDPKTAVRLERTVVTGFHRPYLVSACPITGLMAVSERGSETGRVPCVKVLAPDWNTIRVLGVCAGMGPVLTAPWGLCIDTDGDVLVTDWSEHGHRILLFPSRGVGTVIIAHGLSSPRGLTVLPGGHLGVSDSMHHCVKIYRYKEHRD